VSRETLGRNRRPKRRPKPSKRARDLTFRLKDDPIWRVLSHCFDRRQSAVARSIRNTYGVYDLPKLVSSKVDPSTYSNRTEFAADYLLCSIAKKYQGFDLDIDREQAAFRKWLAAEESCRQSNHFFRRLAEGESPFPPRVIEAFRLIQLKIASILGNIDYDVIRSRCRFGPGSDLSTRADNTSSYNKYASPGTATPWILPLFTELFSEDRREDFLHECEFVQGNRLSFVPKTAVIDRAICVEPRWNIYLQLGIGDLISKRLKRYGLDLEDQTRNQELARLAHVFRLATIDLSSASDTVSKALVLHLLPDDWSDLLFKARSPICFYKGGRYELEKISSMGNGFTFPLESLIFLAISEVACDLSDQPRCVGTYGDDLIVPQESVPTLVELLSYCGFSVNPEKSFSGGKFFESCGKDYFEGVDVRPIFVKKKVSTMLDLFVLANQIVEYSRRLPDVAELLQLGALWAELVKLIPKDIRLFGPCGLGGVLHAPFDACCPKLASTERKTLGWDGWLIKVWVASPIRKRGFDFDGHLFSKLAVDIDTGNDFIPRSSVRWKKKEVYVPTYGEFFWPS